MKRNEMFENFAKLHRLPMRRDTQSNTTQTKTQQKNVNKCTLHKKLHQIYYGIPNIKSERREKTRAVLR